MRWNAFIAVIHPGEDLKLRFRDGARRFAPFRRAARCIEISSQRISVRLEPPPARVSALLCRKRASGMVEPGVDFHQGGRQFLERGLSIRAERLSQSIVPM